MPDLSLLQTWAYGAAKARSGPWQVERAAIYDCETPIGVVQALLRKIPLVGGGLVWINRGPLLAESARSDPAIWYEVLDVLHQRCVIGKGMVLRIAPPLFLSGAGVPGRFQKADGGRGFHSARLDLQEPIEVLRKGLDQKWRNCLNKAERIGVHVESGDHEQLFSDVVRDYSAMLARKPFHTSVTPRLMIELQTMLPVRERLWSIVAKDGNRIVGFVVIARYGACAEYLAGWSHPSGRKWNVGHLLLWRAITEMKDQGYQWFDLGGLDPERTPVGIQHFKSGLGGQSYRLPDEIEAYRAGILSFAVRRAIRRARMLEPTQ